MLFNSYIFFCFLPIAFLGYWACRRRLALQNAWVVLSSYVFYGWWDWRFLLLITFTSFWSYLFGLLEIGGQPRSFSSKCRLALSCVINLGILGYFKYCDFFIYQFVALLKSFGFSAHETSLGIILPVGISFYTFQALSYTIDVYRRVIVPTRDPIAFFAFISFFPQLVAGPIERASNLLPQFLCARRFDYALAVDGSRQMLWGFVKKVLVADYCANAVNSVLGVACPSSVSLWIGMICFAFQIYGDFSGYSDIAIGCAKLFGIRLMRNFDHPYFARDIAEFWRRWHISLTTWFRDYLYIPLGGSRCGMLRKIRNTFAIFLVSGFWHGANWTFIFWGAFHAICFLPLILSGKNRRFCSCVVAEGRVCPSFREVCQMSLTFLVVVLGWTFFRAPDIGVALEWVSRMLTFSNWSLKGCALSSVVTPLICIAGLIVVEWINRERCYPVLPRQKFVRWSVYVLVALALILFRPETNSFIYFQF